MPRALRCHCSCRVCRAPALRDPMKSGTNTCMAQSESQYHQKEIRDIRGSPRYSKNDSYLPFPVLFSFFLGSSKYRGPTPRSDVTPPLGRRCLEQPRQKQRDGSTAEEHPQVDQPNHVRSKLLKVTDLVHDGRFQFCLLAKVSPSAGGFDGLWHRRRRGARAAGYGAYVYGAARMEYHGVCATANKSPESENISLHNIVRRCESNLIGMDGCATGRKAIPS